MVRVKEQTITTSTTKDAVYQVLKARRWISGEEIERTVGRGSLRRLRELRNSYEIKGRRMPNSRAFEYRLVGRKNS